MLRTLNCSQLNNKPTTDNESTTDPVFTNCDGEIEIEEAYWSDHKLLYFYMINLEPHFVHLFHD